MSWFVGKVKGGYIGGQGFDVESKPMTTCHCKGNPIL